MKTQGNSGKCCRNADIGGIPLSPGKAWFWSSAARSPSFQDAGWAALGSPSCAPRQRTTLGKEKISGQENACQDQMCCVNNKVSQQAHLPLIKKLAQNNSFGKGSFRFWRYPENDRITCSAQIRHIQGIHNMTPKKFYAWQTAGGTDDVMRMNT